MATKRLTQAQWAALIAGWSGSGLSQEDYCRQQGVTLANFRRWRDRLAQERAIASRQKALTQTHQAAAEAPTHPASPVASPPSRESVTDQTSAPTQRVTSSSLPSRPTLVDLPPAPVMHRTTYSAAPQLRVLSSHTAALATVPHVLPLEEESLTISLETLPDVVTQPAGLRGEPEQADPDLKPSQETAVPARPDRIDLPTSPNHAVQLVLVPSGLPTSALPPTPVIPVEASAVASSLTISLDPDLPQDLARNATTSLSIREHWRGLVAGWADSGLTLKAYCDLHGVSLEHFRDWRDRFARERASNFESTQTSHPQPPPDVPAVTSSNAPAVEQVTSGLSTAEVSSASDPPASAQRKEPKQSSPKVATDLAVDIPARPVAIKETSSTSKLTPEVLPSGTGMPVQPSPTTSAQIDWPQNRGRSGRRVERASSTSSVAPPERMGRPAARSPSTQPPSSGKRVKASSRSPTASSQAGVGRSVTAAASVPAAAPAAEASLRQPRTPALPTPAFAPEPAASRSGSHRMNGARRVLLPAQGQLRVQSDSPVLTSRGSEEQASSVDAPTTTIAAASSGATRPQLPSEMVVQVSRNVPQRSGKVPIEAPDGAPVSAAMPSPRAATAALPAAPDPRQTSAAPPVPPATSDSRPRRCAPDRSTGQPMRPSQMQGRPWRHARRVPPSYAPLAQAAHSGSFQHSSEEVSAPHPSELDDPYDGNPFALTPNAPQTLPGWQGPSSDGESDLEMLYRDSATQSLAIGNPRSGDQPSATLGAPAAGGVMPGPERTAPVEVEWESRRPASRWQQRLARTLAQRRDDLLGVKHWFEVQWSRLGREKSASRSQPGRAELRARPSATVASDERSEAKQGFASEDGVRTDAVNERPIDSQAVESNESKNARARATEHEVKPNYTQTRTIELDPEYLAAHRVITDLSASPAGAAYKILRTQILQRLRTNGWRTLGITATRQNHGKTLTALNLGISLAMEVNQTVLVADLDLRHPSLANYLSPAHLNGISDYLLGYLDISEIMVHPGIARLVILPGRESMVNSSEQLSSPRMVQLVEELKTRYPDRIVLFDLPPLFVGDDVMAFAPNVDAILLVLEEGKTTREELRRAYELLDGQRILGTILNKSIHNLKSTF